MEKFTPTDPAKDNSLPDKAAPRTPYLGDGNEDVLLKGMIRMLKKRQEAQAKKEAPVK
jgi:hypothetical protein